MTPHIVLDLSRLMWRATRFAPTGIDRVELAYARHLIATARDRLSFTGWWGRLSVLPGDDAIAMIARLDTMWSGSAIDDAARAKVQALVARLRRHVLLRGEAPLHAHLAGLKQPIVYLLVSHYRLHRPTGIARIKRKFGARVAMLIHDLIPIDHPDLVPAWQARRHQRRMINVAWLADLAIVNSTGTGEALRRHLAMLGKAVPIVVAPLGIDLVPSRDAPAAQTAAPYFVYVATIEPRKNHALLVEAWRRLGPGAPKLVLVGRRGWKSKDILDAIRAAPWMAGLIEEHNRLPDVAVARLVGGACASLNPSIAEGYGLPVAEALALGVPVVCSDLAELREVGGAVPDYLDPRDAAAWARVLADYARPWSETRQTQLQRLKNWHAPSWSEHFRIVQPLIDDAGVPKEAPR